MNEWMNNGVSISKSNWIKANNNNILSTAEFFYLQKHIIILIKIIIPNKLTVIYIYK